MATKKILNIGLIGGGFMARTHSNGYRRVANFFPELEFTPVLKAVCFRNETKLKAFAEQWGYESVETDWKKLIARSDIDAIDICTPNDTHAEIAIAAAKAGKMIMCEKPLARNLVESEGMVDAIEKAGVKIPFGIIIAGCLRLPSPNKLLTPANWEKYIITGLIFFRTGLSAKIFRKVERDCGAWMLP